MIRKINNRQKRDELIDGYFNQGWCCDLDEVKNAVFDTINELEQVNDKKVIEIEKLKKEYERLLNIARKMHTWIFLHTGNEKEVYDELGLTDEENALLGYGGQYQFQAYTGEPTLKNIEGKNLLVKEVENEE